MFGGQNYNYILIALGRLRVGENSEVNFEGIWLRSLQCSVFTEEVYWLFA